VPLTTVARVPKESLAKEVTCVPHWPLVEERANHPRDLSTSVLTPKESLARAATLVLESVHVWLPSTLVRATSRPRDLMLLDLDPREATSLPSREVVLKTVTWKVRHGTAMVTLQSVEVDPTSQAREPTLLDLEARDLTSHPRVSLPSMVPRESHPRAHLPLMVPRDRKERDPRVLLLMVPRDRKERDPRVLPLMVPRDPKERDPRVLPLMVPRDPKESRAREVHPPLHQFLAHAFLLLHLSNLRSASIPLLPLIFPPLLPLSFLALPPTSLLHSPLLWSLRSYLPWDPHPPSPLKLQVPQRDLDVMPKQNASDVSTPLEQRDCHVLPAVQSETLHNRAVLLQFVRTH
jgi:hypothetical protein